jgi:septal ring factor EnvC (AmiA/AmiB activator)
MTYQYARRNDAQIEVNGVGILQQEESGKAPPWSSAILWLSGSSLVLFVLVLIWVFFSGSSMVVKSSDAMAAQLGAVQRELASLEKRQTKAEERLDKIANGIEEIAREAKATAKAARRANRLAKQTRDKMDILLSHFAPAAK